MTAKLGWVIVYVPDVEAAIGFYERLGWTITGPGFVDDEMGIPHHPMELVL